MNKTLLTAVGALCLNWAGTAFGADFVAVRIEAEDFTSKSDRWVLTSPGSTTDLQPDPDPPHNDSASGQANLELLPDTRVTHEDTVLNGGMDGNFWGGPGGGPRIDYQVNVPEAGRYFVYVKTYSTGTEDNGLHVGVNGTLPQSGQRIQICSKHNWQWTSGQRTNDNHCGVTKTIWLDFPSAGVNTITFFAREDGFEIDQFLLLKEIHDGSKDCFPTFGDKIRCRDVATGATLGDTDIPFSQTVNGNDGTQPPQPEPEPEPEPQIVEVDLDIDLNVIGATHHVNETLEYQVKVSNKSQDTASNAVAVMNLPGDLEFSSSADCSETSSIVTCNIGNISAGANQTVSFFATVLAEGNYRVDAQATADEVDPVGSNNMDSANISASYSIPAFEAGINMVQKTNANAVGGENEYAVTVTNNGRLDITDANFQVNTDSGITVDGCNPACTIPAIAPGESTQLSFRTVANKSGVFNVTAQLILDSDADNSNNSASLTETVITSPIAIGNSGSDEIVIEAEAFTTSSSSATENAPEWFVIGENFNQLPASLDPDNASSIGVSGNTYVELLPDTRIDENAPLIDGASNFNAGGTGSTLTYNVFFSEAGNYNIYARIRANNTQDASLHAGLNNDWPASASNLSICNPDGSWQWTNNVRTSDGCNSASSAFITVDAPGMHTLMVSQSTDGLELDKLILSMDPVTGLNDNGPAASQVDPAVAADLRVDVSLSQDSITEGESTDLLVSVRNHNLDNDASGVMVTISGIEIDNLSTTTFDSCTASNSTVICTLSTLAANQQVTETFTIEAQQPDTMTVNASVLGLQSDANSQNNSAQATLDVTAKKASGGGSLSVWLLLSLLLLTGIQGLTRDKACPARNNA